MQAGDGVLGTAVQQVQVGKVGQRRPLDADELRVGRVSDPSAWRFTRVSGERLEQMVSEWAGPRAWDSTRRVDALLTRFVEGLAAAGLPGPQGL